MVINCKQFQQMQQLTIAVNLKYLQVNGTLLKDLSVFNKGAFPYLSYVDF